MTDKKALVLLVVIMAATALIVGAVCIGSLYAAEMKGHRHELVAAAREQASALAVSAIEADDGDVARDPALYRHLGQSGRVIVGRLSDDALVLRAATQAPAKAARRPLVEGSPLGSLMRRALGGESGSAIVMDGAGERVLAAHEPAVANALGVVAIMDLSEIRAPFIDATAIAGGATALLIAASAFAFFAIGKPLLARGRQRDDRYRELFENMRTGAAVFGGTGKGGDIVFKDFNRGAERIDDVERSEVIGRTLGEVFPGAGEHGLIDALRRVGRTGAPEHFPVVYYRDDRRAGWREGDIYRLPSGDIVLLYEDVSERQRAEEALRDSEARWRAIIEMQSVAIVIVDSQHKIRFVNRAAEALFAKNSRELIGVEFGFPVVQNGIAEIEIIRPSRPIAYVEMRATPMRWAGEDQFLLMLQDISTHRRAEGDLRKLFQGVEQSPVSVVITDINGTIEYVNPKFTDVTGYTYPEVVGKNPRVLKSGHTLPEQYAELWQTISKGDVWRGEFHNKRKNGEVFWELAAIAPVRDVRGKITHYVAVKEDITERKATEERLRRSQRLELVGQLTGGIAHDFNNVLAIILGNLELLQEKGAGDDEDRELVADALWSAERGAELIHRLLAFARRQRLHPKVVDLNHVVGEMTDLLRRTLGERIEVVENLAPEIWSTMIDPGQLESALLNLVVNARDAMPDGGKVTIVTANAVLDSPDAVPSQDWTPGEYASVAVSDTGTGMAAETAERIFEPFFTTKKFGRGSGLGLSMVYGFVRQSGGHVTVESEIGRGTTIRLFLPKATSGEKTASQGAGATQPVSLAQLAGEARAGHNPLDRTADHGHLKDSKSW